MKKIGLIGGAGPEAGALLLKNIVQNYQEQGAWEDHHFPRIMLISQNFSPMLESNKNHSLIVQELQSAVDLINTTENEIVSIACNTLHSFVAHIHFKNLQFISIVDTVVHAIQQENVRTILFLGTKTSVRAQIYETTDTIKIIYPSEQQQELIHDCIVRILKNHHTQTDATLMNNIIEACKNTMSFDGVILGCTELSVLHQAYPLTPCTTLTLYDPIDILGKHLARL